MKILAIETSCDETAMAIVEARGGLSSPQFKILENIVSSQIKIHRPFGGVVPNLAKREHLKNLPIIYKKIFQELNSHAGATVNELRHSSTVKKKNSSTHQLFNSSTIDLIAVTVGPGLEPALWTGIEFAKEIQKDSQSANRKARIALVGANHMEGHLFSFLLANQKKTENSKHEARNSKQKPITNSKLPVTDIFPAIALVVSGGHTILLKMDSLTKWKKLGETRDDAAGEAFDKVARILKLPYPGGPEIQKLAEKGNPKAIPFPRPMLRDKNYEFSFSGLKTSVLYYLRDNPSFGSAQDKRASKADVAASFQQAVLDVLVGKTVRAAREFGAKSILLSGGVAANKALRANLQLMTDNLRLNFFVPSFEYNTDNAVMIAVAAYIRILAKKKPYALTADSNLNL